LHRSQGGPRCSNVGGDGRSPVVRIGSTLSAFTPRKHPGWGFVVGVLVQATSALRLFGLQARGNTQKLCCRGSPTTPNSLAERRTDEEGESTACRRRQSRPSARRARPLKDAQIIDFTNFSAAYPQAPRRRCHKAVQGRFGNDQLAQLTARSATM